jgi:hypothetical protein
MKHITKLASIAALTAAFGATVALADDAQLQNRLSLQRAQNPSADRNSTVAVYSNRQGIGRVVQDERPELRFEIRATAHGAATYTYVPVK